MPLQPAIQFYVTEGMLTQDEAELLTEAQVEALSTAFARGFIVNGCEMIVNMEEVRQNPRTESLRIINGNIEREVTGTEPIMGFVDGGTLLRILLQMMSDHDFQAFSGVQTCIDENILTLDQALALPKEKVALLGHNLIRGLITTGRFTLEQALAIEPFAIYSFFDKLQAIIDRGLITQDRALTLTEEQASSLIKFGSLIENDTFTVDQVIGLTLGQQESLDRIRELVAASEIDLRMREFTVPGSMSYSCNLGEERQEEIANGIRALIVNNILTLDQILNAPNLGQFDNRINSLIVHGRITMTQAQALTEEQQHKLQCDGVYDLMTDGTVTLDQIFALTQGQCYQLDNQAIRDQVIAGELALADIPEPEPQEVNPLQHNQHVPINNSQSTHTASVHRTVSESAIRLMNRYGDQLSGSGMDQIIRDITTRVNELPDGDPINEAAKRCISRIATSRSTYTDPGSHVNVHQLLALSWLAIHDDAPRLGSLADAERQFCEGLYEIQRGYNLSETGVDLNGADSSICTAGTFNKLVEKLEGVHPDVVIEFITSRTAALKFPIVVREEVQQYLAARANPQTSASFVSFTHQLKQLEEEGIDIIWDTIKDRVATRMFDEFGSLYTDKDDHRFTSFIDTGKYVSLERLPSFQRELSESKGYHQYCSAILRSTGLFSGLARQNIGTAPASDEMRTNLNPK